jgi:hypothetical protein
MKKLIALSLLTIVGLSTLAASVVAMQRGGWDRNYRRDSRGGVPVWETDANFETDVFTFARVQFDDAWGGRRGKWRTDYPDSDLNFSLRLHQLTSMKVNPQPAIVRLDSPELFRYPFVYMIEPGEMLLSQAEVLGLRRFCENGGFMMVDDFWGDDEWQNFEREMRKVFPDRKPVDVPLEHPIFHMVYDLKEKPQVPAYDPWGNWRFQTHESRHYGDSQTVHYRSISDDNGRIMVFICHNTDIGDAWEQEGTHPDYFRDYSVKKSYPLGVNIVTYAMTH